MINSYDWVLFDADDTLFHFDALSGLKHTFAGYGIQFEQKDYEDYQALNQPLWNDYSNHRISAQHLQEERFRVWGKRLGINPAEINHSFLENMANICYPLKGAVQLLNNLKGRCQLGIITNGFKILQQKRIDRTGLQDLFQVLIISEEVGVAKPHIKIFDHALELMGSPKRERVLMVGDTLDTDIRGGREAGLDTCWLNTKNLPAPPDNAPKFQVASLMELEALLVGIPQHELEPH